MIGCNQNLAPVEIGEGSIYSLKTETPKPLKKPTSQFVNENNLDAVERIGNTISPIKRIENQERSNHKNIIIKEGDTVYRIANLYQVNARSIIEENGLKAPFKLLVGQILTLPPEKLFHMVKEGETLYGLAMRYDVDLNTLVKINNMLPPYKLSVGYNLRIPRLGAIANESYEEKQRSVMEVRKESGEVKKERVPPRSGPNFMWSARGKIISGFGPKVGGLRNDGINVALPTGTPVRAAENGLVVYSGNELPGYGNLLLIRHSEGWISTYAHNQSLKVERGDLVTKGQIISYSGSTGNVATPQLHFELRLYGKPVDPITYLARQE